jgi:RHS repeat-associated protein
MAGISSKAAGKIQNRLKFNGGDELQNGEFSDGTGLETYDAVHRMYDPQIGRFGQIDKLAELGIDFTPYGFVRDNPILLNDPLGLKEDTASGKPLPEFIGKPSSKKQVASKQLNQMDYGQITGWIDGQRKKGNSIDAIQNWVLSNKYLSNNTVDKILDATSPTSLAIRKANDEEWAAEGELYRFFLESLLVTAGGEVLEFVDLGEAASSVKSASQEAKELYEESGRVANYLVKKNLSKYMKNAPDLVKLGKQIKEINKYSKVIKEVGKSIVKEVLNTN